jgi:tetratricopeptide (TPR) repeat protein
MKLDSAPAVLSVVLLGTALPVAAVESVDKQRRQAALEHYREGERHMRSEKWDVAEREFRAAIVQDPLLTLAHYSLGQTYMATRRYPDAVSAFTACNEAYMALAGLAVTDSAIVDQRRDDEIRELRDTITAYQSGLAKSLQAQNTVLRLENRLQELERQKQRGPSSMELPAGFSLALGSAYFRSGKLAEAEREYLQAIKANPRMGEAHNNLAVVYMMTGRVQDAESAIKAAEKAGFSVNPQLKKDIQARK